MVSVEQYLKYLVGMIVGILCIWVALTGRLGSLLGAFFAPDYMVEGTPPPEGNWQGGSIPGVTSSPPIQPQNTNKNTVLDMASIGYYAYYAGIRTQTPLSLSIAIAMAESGGRVGAVGGPNSDGSYDYGLWQINAKAHPSYDVGQLQSSATYNAQAMYTISNSGTNWGPWTTYTNGAYKQYLSGATQAAIAVIAGEQGASQK